MVRPADSFSGAGYERSVRVREDLGALFGSSIYLFPDVIYIVFNNSDVILYSIIQFLELILEFFIFRNFLFSISQ